MQKIPGNHCGSKKTWRSIHQTRYKQFSEITNYELQLKNFKKKREVIPINNSKELKIMMQVGQWNCRSKL